MGPGPVLKVEDLRVSFSTRRGVGMAVNGVSFEVKKGETLGLVGESGCGKSTVALSIMKLLPRPPAKFEGGRVLFEGEDLMAMDEEEVRSYRGRHIGMIFQDPMSSLNPVYNINFQVAEPLRIHQGLRGSALVDQVVTLLRRMRIPAPENRARDYPHQFSGGMRQRVVGSIALSCEPELIIADEPTTALDATIQAQYLNLLRELQEDTGVAILLITHDFSVVAKMCHRVAVMYAGTIVETAEVETIFNNPAHPYTQALMAAVPDIAAWKGHLSPIDGSPPSIYETHRGCPFAPRCAVVQDRCREEAPPETQRAKEHGVRCWLHV
ncbi:MAG: ABC transporter ATP-binding protein [Chloroflexi bacterium]|nr:ABC transporter ATP-binding protein [Chloroflexota bacterium]